MPGANAPLDTVALASETAPIAILGRFPAGFSRERVGGYRVAEEFVVLAGDLRYDDLPLTSGALVHVGAHRVRMRLASTGGCLVLAWFGGPPLFRRESELASSRDGALQVNDISTMTGPIRTPLSVWRTGAVSGWPRVADGFDRDTWAASRDDWLGSQDDTVTWRETIEAT